MKRSKLIIVALSLFLILTASLIVINAMTDDEIVGSEGLTYHLSDDGKFYIVSNYNNRLSDVNVVIPEEYKGLPVTEIANDAFAERKWIQSVYIPKTIKKIGHGAFSQTGLKKVYFNAENCQDFDSRNWVFYPESQGKMSIDVVIGKDVKKIPKRLFFPLDTIPTLNPKVTSITFEEGCQVDEIGDYAFYNISHVSNIVFPSSLRKIGKYAFYGNKFTEVIFNSGLEEINDHAFDNSKEIKSFSLPNSIIRVGKAAFRNCLLLESVQSTSSSYTTLEADTFKYCVNLKNIKLDKVNCIGESVFEGCTSLASYDMPNIKHIGDYAFKDCTGIKNIILDTNLETIGNHAFEGCTNVSDIVLKSKLLKDLEPANGTFYNCGANSEGVKVIVEGEVVSVPKRLFFASSNGANLPKITEIIINTSSLKTIDDYAFGYINASVTYVGTKTMWNGVSVNIGNNCFAKVNCVKEMAGE